MALPATDTFTVGANTDLSAYANWTVNVGELEVVNVGDDLRGKNNNGYSLAYWDADAFGNDHYSQFTASDTTEAVDEMGPAVRVHASAHTGYYFRGNGANCELYKVVAGSHSSIATGGAAWAAAEDIRLEVIGTTLDPKIDGTTEATLGQQTDSAIASGSAGVQAFENEQDLRLDDFEADDLAGGGRTTKNTDPYGLGIALGVSRTFKVPG